MEFNDRRPEAQYTVITQHGADRKVKRTKFSTFDEAKAYTQANTPDTDAHMAPNVDQKHVDHKNYEAGGFWFGNRHAAIHKRLKK